MHDVRAVSKLAHDLGMCVECQESALREWRTGYASSQAAYIIAEPGFPNFGDELIASEWIKYLAAIRPDLPIVIDCNRPGSASAILSDLHPNIRFVDTIARLTFELPVSYGEEIASGGRHTRVGEKSSALIAALKDEGRAARYAAGIRLLNRRVKCIHFLGGGYMNGMWEENLSRLAVAIWGSERGLPILGTGLGLSPLDGATLDFARNAAESFDLLAVRDIETFNELAGCKSVYLAPDDVFVNALSGCFDVNEAFPNVMVCIQTDMVDDAAALHQHVIAILKKWGVNENDCIGIVECNPYIDSSIMDVMRREGFACHLFPAADLIENGLPVKSGQIWLTTRYHPHLLASAYGCRGCYIPIDDGFYRYKHEAVVRMGSRWSCSRIGEEVPDPGKGFESFEICHEYSRLIRGFARQLYGV